MIAPQQEYDRLNDQAVNQHAKRLLESVGESPDPSSLYLLQLCQWGLMSGVVDLSQGQSVRDNLEAMETWQPQNVLSFLLGESEEEQEVSESEVLSFQEAEDLAAFLLQLLHQRLMSYRTI